MNRFRQCFYRGLVVCRFPSAVGRLLAAGALALALAAGPGAPRATAVGYTITDLGSLGGNRTLPAGLNNLGQVVGRSNTAPVDNAPMHGFLYDGTGMHDVGDLVGHPGAIAYGISDTGQLVGAAPLSSDPWAFSHAFLYDGAFHDLGTLPAGNISIASYINAQGHIAGRLTTFNDTPIRTFLYDGTSMRDLGGFPGYYHVYPWGMNASDQIVGELAPDGFSNAHAFLWKDGALHDLGTLGGHYSIATGINDAGQVVGNSLVTDNGPQHAFLYDGTGMHDLGTLGGSGSFAWAINNLGQVAGYSETAAGSYAGYHLFLYSDGVMRDLDPLFLSRSPWVSVYVVAINDHGQILVQGNIDNREHAYLLTPIPAPQLRVSTESIDFGGQPVGTTSAAQTVTLTNDGELPLVVDSVGIDGMNPFRFTIASDTGETTLAPGASRTITVTFNPLAGSSYTAALKIQDNDQHLGTVHRVELSGNGTLPSLSLSLPADYGNHAVLVGDTSDDYHIGITNSGLAPLVIHGITITGANAGEFTATDMSGVTLAPNEGRSISVLFTPGARGTRTATLTVGSNTPEGPVRVPLVGYGIAPLVSLSPGSLNFGQQALGVVNNAQAVTIQNTGDAPLDIQSVSVTGANPSDFVIAGDGWTGAHLLPGQIATLNVRFAPTAAGDRSAALTIEDNAAPNSQSVALSGTGTAPAAILSAASLDFSEQLVGTTSGEQTVSLTNIGTAPLQLGTLSLSGANAGDFSAAADPGGLALAPGESRTLRVRFRPSAAGSRDATLSITDGAPDSPQTLVLTGTGSAPSIQVGISRVGSPSSVSFGNQALGTTGASQTVTITNSGSAPLMLMGISLAGANAADFALVEGGGPGTLAPGGSRTLTLRFTPLSSGSRAASLTLYSNAPGNATSIALTGRGILPTSGPGGLALIPNVAELTATVEGATAGTKRAVVSVGQSVTLKLLVKFKNGAVADVSTDPNVRFLLNAPRGQFTAKNVWKPKAEDSGKTLVLYGRYYSPFGRQRIVDQVTVIVLSTRRRGR